MPHRRIAAAIRERRLPGIEDLVSVGLLVAVLVVFGMSTYGIYQNLVQARRTHAALCTLRQSRIDQNIQAQKFLMLSQEEKIKQYGEALGTIPDSAVREGIQQRNVVIHSLDNLHCK